MAKRGRPPKNGVEKMSAAERMRKYRALRKSVTKIEDVVTKLSDEIPVTKLSDEIPVTKLSDEIPHWDEMEIIRNAVDNDTTISDDERELLRVRYREIVDPMFVSSRIQRRLNGILT